MASPWRAQRLTSSTTTIFAEMSALAVATGSINLGQGFPDSDGPDFMLEAARQAKKPVVLMKVGTSVIGQHAAKSHTASIAGDDRVDIVVLPMIDGVTLARKKPRRSAAANIPEGNA